MNIYKLSQTINTGYDTVDSCVVVAPTAEIAKTINPRPTLDYAWAAPVYIKAELLGEAEPWMEQGIVCASFNAG